MIQIIIRHTAIRSVVGFSLPIQRPTRMAHFLNVCVFIFISLFRVYLPAREYRPFSNSLRRSAVSSFHPHLLFLVHSHRHARFFRFFPIVSFTRFRLNLLLSRARVPSILILAVSRRIRYSLSPLTVSIHVHTRVRSLYISVHRSGQVRSDGRVLPSRRGQAAVWLPRSTLDSASIDVSRWHRTLDERKGRLPRYGAPFLSFSDFLSLPWPVRRERTSEIAKGGGEASRSRRRRRKKSTRRIARVRRSKDFVSSERLAKNG